MFASLASATAWALDFTGNDTASGTLDSSALEQDINFRDDSSAGSAGISNPSDNFATYFLDDSNAGSATISNSDGGQTIFDGRSSAANASIVGDTQFLGQSTAGNARLSVEFGSISFSGQSSAGNAEIRVSDYYSQLSFSERSTAGNARLIAENGAFVRFAGTGPNDDGNLSAGSIEGDGIFELDAVRLAVGGNDLSTELSGSLIGGVDSALIKRGSGVLTLSGFNSSFAGALIVEQGLINFSDPSGLGSGALTLNGGGLQWAVDNGFDISDRLAPLGPNGGVFDTNGNFVVLGSAIGGSGALIKTGDGLLLLAAANGYSGGTVLEGGTLAGAVEGALPNATAYTVNGGTLELSSFDLQMSSLAGSGGAIQIMSTLTVDQASDTRFAGVLSGSGTFVKDGAGLLELTGSSSLSGSSEEAGSAEVRGGTLAVNGSLLADIRVLGGGILGGTGTVGSVQLANGGILAPGTSIGTLNVDGDLVFDPGSVYQVETDAAGNADRVVASGPASLAGTVQVLAENGTYAPSTSYSILSAGQLSGQFDSVSSNLAFLDPSLSYDGSDVTLTLTRNDISFTSLARTPNQRAFAEAAESLDQDNEVYRTLLDLGEDEVADTFNRLSGDAHASIASSVLFDDLNLSRAPLGNLRRNLAAPERALPYWVQVGGGRQRIDDDGNAGEIIQDHESMLLGGDWPVYGDWRLGGAFGYGQEQLDVDSRDAKADSDSYRYALYGGRDFQLSRGILKLFGGGGYSQHQIDSRRDVRLIDGPQRLTRQYDVNTAQGFGELAWHLKFGEPAYVEPFVGLLLIDQRGDSFSEKGGAAALSADSQRNELLSSSLGVRGQQLFQLAERDLLLNGSFTWRQINGDLRPELDLQLEGGDRFRVLGTELPRNSFLVELNADYSITPNIVLDIDYNGVFSDSSNANNIAFNLRWKM
ncbi:autotransporter domain-containing protein [Pseudomonas sp. SP16.1]|uniref:autotransporter domain-containing protein n=1 Tax=Pseudomonas sp. SP16.1 TaxID=3458854 RepID=UPI0040465C2E